MEKLAKYGFVWRHRKTNKMSGSKIDVKTAEELSEYEQVPREKEKPEEKSNDLFSPNKTRRTNNVE